jgi:hypothetical protein
MVDEMAGVKDVYGPPFQDGRSPKGRRRLDGSVLRPLEFREAGVHV